MFLRSCVVAVCAMGAASAMAQVLAEPEHQWTDDVVGSHTLQVGLDAWNIQTSAQEDTTANMNSLSRLQLANSYPVWNYQNPTEWLRFEGALRIGRDTLLAMKYRSDQSTGSRLDEASVDWAFHTYGVKLGVVDPKISWCRTYDMDSPWVRENNPFCSIQPLNFTKGSAPGAQTYTNFIFAGYSMQAIAGVYRPLWLNYAPTETPTLVLTPNGVVKSHTKSGLALSATNLRNGTEFRLGLLRDQFTGRKDSSTPNLPYHYDLNSDVVFVGANWYASQKIAIRATYFTYAGNLIRTKKDASTSFKFYQQNDYKARSLEVNYQQDARNVYSASYVRYIYNSDSQSYDLQPIEPLLLSAYQGAPHFVTINSAVSWRRDWGQGFFTVLQYSDAKLVQSNAIDKVQLSSNGKALGLRLGYRF
jgi:hypothetical protein